MIEDKLPQTLDEVRGTDDGLDKGLIELLAPPAEIGTAGWSSET